MRFAVAALAVTAACKFSHGNPPDRVDDASPTDSPMIDSPRLDASLTDGMPDMMPDGGTPALLMHDFEADLEGPFTGIYTMPNDAVGHASLGHNSQKSAVCSTQQPFEAQAALYYNFSLRTQLYASMWLRLSSGFPPSDYVMVMAFVNDVSTWTNIAQVSVFPNRKVSVYNNTLGIDTFSTATLSQDIWHRIEVLVKVSPTTGRLFLAVDGVTQFDMKNINTGSLQFHRILTGIAWQGAPNDPTTLYIDDVRLE